MVTRWDADCIRVRSLRLVESLFTRSHNARDARARTDGGGVRTAAMVVRRIDLCFRRPRADHLQLFAEWARLPRDTGSGERNTYADRHPVYGIRLLTCRERSCGVSCQCAGPSC